MKRPVSYRIFFLAITVVLKSTEKIADQLIPNESLASFFTR
ncbi:hypothetical protein [Bacillus wiedmannii]